MNHSQPCRRFFISGTNTEVGKTFVGCLLAEHLRYSGIPVGIYKPVASDCRIEADEIIADDARNLWIAAGKPRTLQQVCPQKFFAPLAPPQAARAEGKQVNIDQLHEAANGWVDDYKVLLVEGAGGLLSPLAEGMLNIDLVKRLHPIEVIVVAANCLGTIHQTLATCTAAIAMGVTPVGIVLNDVSETLDLSASENAEEIAKYTEIPILGRVPYRATRQAVATWADTLFQVASHESRARS